MGIFKPVLKKTCESSSMKALPRIMKATTRFQKFLWILALLLGLGGATYQLVKLFMGYFRFATGVNIVEELGSPPFPDVTVCPLDTSWTIRMMERQFGEEVSYQKHVENILQARQQMSDVVNYYLRVFGGYVQNMEMREEKASHLKNLFMISCLVSGKWLGKPQACSEHPNVTTSVFIDPLLGLCVTLKLNNDILEYLELTLYLDNHPVPIDMVNKASIGFRSPIGANVIIHPPGTFPDLMYFSKPIPPGVDMTFKVEGSKRTILPDPYSDCTSNEDPTKTLHRGDSGYELNRHGFECYRLKGRDYILETCSCLFVTYDSHEFDMRGEYIDLCGHLDMDNISTTVEKMNCALGALETLMKSHKEVSCPTPCESYTYDYSTQALDWPDEQYQIPFYEEYVKKSALASQFTMYEDYVKNTSGRDRPEFSLIQKNFTHVTIQKDQFKYLHYSDTPLVTLESLFGTVGGVLSLWVGITFITIIEIVDFIYQLCTKKKERQTPEKIQLNG